MRLRRLLVAGAALAAMSPLACADDAPSWQVDVVVPGSAFHGVHGLAFDADGNLYAGSVAGQTIDRVDRTTGAVENVIPPPEGMADDIAFGPDGMMAWTGYLTGEVRVRFADGTITLLASGMPGANSLAFAPDGTLYVTQVFLGDALWRMDPRARSAPIRIAENLGGLNGFEVGPDGMIYGPIWFRGEIAKVDPATGAVTTIASGFTVPAAANFGPDGMLYVIDTALGQLFRVDPATGEKSVIAQLDPALDNLAIDANGLIVVSNMADNGIQEIDPNTGSIRQIIKGSLATTGGLALSPDGKIIVADTFAVRNVDPVSGEVKTLARMFGSDIGYPNDIALSADGKSFLVTSFITNSFQLRDAQTFAVIAARADLAAPSASIDGGDGYFYFAEIGLARISRMAATGGELTIVASEIMAPSALARAPDGKGLYVVESDAGRVTLIDIAGGLRTTIADGLKQPEALAVDNDGTLVITEIGRQCVVRIDPASATRTDLACNLPIGLPAPAGMPGVFIKSGVAIASDGTIYVAGDLDNSLLRLTRN